MSRPAILVSACLLGVNCRYSGDASMLPRLEELMRLAEVIPVCPEILGGLSTPRTPAERCGERVIARDGADVTEQYRRGARETLHLMRLFGAKYALMKERSPSCGSGVIYDGSFTHARIPGDGVAAELLKQSGVEVFGESRADELMERLKGEAAK